MRLQSPYDGPEETHTGPLFSAICIAIVAAITAALQVSVHPAIPLVILWLGSLLMIPDDRGNSRRINPPVGRDIIAGCVLGVLFNFVTGRFVPPW